MIKHWFDYRIEEGSGLRNGISNMHAVAKRLVKFYFNFYWPFPSGESH